MSKQRQDLAEVHPQLASLRAAKGEAGRKYAMSTEEPAAAKEAEATHENKEAPEPEDNPTSMVPDSTDPSPSPQEPAQAEDVDWKKRYDDSRTYINKLQEEIKLHKDNGKPAVEIPKTTEELEEFKKQRPEEYDTILSLIRTEGKGLSEELDRAKEELASIQKATKTESLFSEVLKLHPDAGEIRKSPEWVEWFKEQTAGVRALIESDNVQDISRGISLYKSDKGIGKTNDPRTGKSAEDAAAIDMKSTSSLPSDPKVYTATEIRNMSDKQYAKHRDAIKAAKREGRYDPTK